METQFKQILVNNLTKKELSPSSIKLYTKNLEKLNDGKPMNNFSFLKKVDETLKKLEHFKENTRRNYLISIVSCLQTHQNTKADKALYNKYLELLKAKNQELKKEESQNEKTEVQDKNWIKWSDVETKFKELEAEVMGYKKKIDEKQYNKLLKFIILSLYYYNPPRRNQDYYMNIVKSKDNNDNENNLLAIDNKQFIFNKYKTIKKHGIQSIDIGDEQMKAIKQYLKYHPLIKGKVIKSTNVPFLVNYDASPLNQTNAITRILNSIFKKKVGSSMLRHIYLSDKYGKILEQQKKDAEAMAHNVSMQKDYIKTE